ncbi:pentatricopeptide repeat-containing protein At1g08070, chloroplastic-like [Nymphaea colorata]|uniref:Pentacotripeptide-repeat region of PRORP domain-containing protein n=1 Tax=Nymphaea colorata TaxID=210225 RepID=A0A5K1G4C2_9MAGN|nr:pentatricopeptide repeat-containing protein At1g08070, chloroplastic-like [Nymphaea colorata]
MRKARAVLPRYLLLPRPANSQPQASYSSSEGASPHSYHLHVNASSCSFSSSLELLLQRCRTIVQLNPVLSRIIIAGLLHRKLFVCRIVRHLAFSQSQNEFLVYARLIVEHVIHEQPNSFLFNTVIRAYSRNHSPEEAIRLYVQMLRIPVPPDNFTYPFVIRAANVRALMAEGLQVQGHIIKNGFDSDVFVLNTLISMYSDHGEVDSARQLFEQNRQVVDIVSWNALIDGYAKSGSVEVARQLFDEMPERNDVSWSTMISGYARHGELGIANALFDRMPYRNSVTWNSMISGFARIGILPIARKMFDEMPCKNTISWNAMITAYAQSGDVDSARDLFDKMPDKDVVSWSSMIAGYTQYGRFRDAVSLFKRMLLEKDVKPNEVTMVSVLSACAHMTEIDLGKWIHAYIDRCNIKLDDNLGAALIDMYAKCGNIEAAEQVFCNLKRRNISAWNALIVGFAMHGNADDSLKAFSRMQDSNTNPNSVTFLGVLTACSHAGLVDEGRRYFDNMLKDHNILPNLKHYGCMVDMLGRAGLLEEAEELVKSMPMKPDIMILGALLGACRIHGNTEVADRIKDGLLGLESGQAGCHVLLSNVYAAAGKWNEALEIRKVIKEKGIRKQPGSSLVDLNVGE